MITVKSEADVEKMRVSGQMTAATFEYIADFVRVGVSTAELDQKIEAFIIARGGKPAFKGMYGFPASACISVNEEVVHGLPGARVLRDGDIVTIDLGVEKDGFFGDSAYTFAVGDPAPEVEALLRVTQKALYAGMAMAKSGQRVSDIGHAVESIVAPHGYGIVRDLVGHGIGRKLHEDPQIPNFGEAGHGAVLQSGMTLAIEPMVNAGTFRVKTLADGWTVVTADGQRSAHYEHTVVVRDNGPEIVTEHGLKRW
jgi:methionyl aminopeptidase